MINLPPEPSLPNDSSWRSASRAVAKADRSPNGASVEGSRPVVSQQLSECARVLAPLSPRLVRPGQSPKSDAVTHRTPKLRKAARRRLLQRTTRRPDFGRREVPQFLEPAPRSSADQQGNREPGGVRHRIPGKLEPDFGVRHYPAHGRAALRAPALGLLNRAPSVPPLSALPVDGSAIRNSCLHRSRFSRMIDALMKSSYHTDNNITHRTSRRGLVGLAVACSLALFLSSGSFSLAQTPTPTPTPPPDLEPDPMPPSQEILPNAYQPSAYSNDETILRRLRFSPDSAIWGNGPIRSPSRHIPVG